MDARRHLQWFAKLKADSHHSAHNIPISHHSPTKIAWKLFCWSSRIFMPNAPSRSPFSMAVGKNSIRYACIAFRKLKFKHDYVNVCPCYSVWKMSTVFKWMYGWYVWILHGNVFKYISNMLHNVHDLLMLHLHHELTESHGMCLWYQICFPVYPELYYYALFWFRSFFSHLYAICIVSISFHLTTCLWQLLYYD